MIGILLYFMLGLIVLIMVVIWLLLCFIIVFFVLFVGILVVLVFVFGFDLDMCLVGDFVFIVGGLLEFYILMVFLIWEIF